MLNQEIRDYILLACFKGRPADSFDDDFNLLDSGVMDSLAIINTVTWLEQQYGIEFGDDDFAPEHFTSVNALANFVSSRQ
jgi:acyl carrier protein